MTPSGSSPGWVVAMRRMRMPSQALPVPCGAVSPHAELGGAGHKPVPSDLLPPQGLLACVK